MAERTFDPARLRELAEAAFAEAPRPLILNAYDHGGGRLYGLRPGEPGTQRLVADFYEQANRDLFTYLEMHLREIVGRLDPQRGSDHAPGEWPDCSPLLCGHPAGSDR